MRRVAVGLAAVLAAYFTGPAIGEALRSISPSMAAVGFRSAARAAPPCSEESAGPCSEPGAEQQTGAQSFRLIPTSRWPAIRSTTHSPGQGPEDLSGPDDDDPLPE
jgi:hypothetical protein